jgi:hypothetical protein
MNASNQESKGPRPWPGVQGAGYPLGVVPLPPAAQAYCFDLLTQILSPAAQAIVQRMTISLSTCRAAFIHLLST